MAKRPPASFGLASSAPFAEDKLCARERPAHRVDQVRHAQAQIVGHLYTANVVLPGGQVLLVGGPRVFALPPVGAPASWSVPIPPDTSLLGRSVATQAVHLLGLTPYALSNAQDLTIGY